MEITSITGRRVENDLVRNLSRIVGRRIFRYKNISVMIVINSATHVYIKFMDNLDSNWACSICQINVFVHGYNLVGSIDNGSLYIESKGFFRDRYNVYKWLNEKIKEYKKSRR